MANRDVLAIGASAGGVTALRFLASQFAPDLRASVLVVLHLPSGSDSGFDGILSRAGPLPASFARDGERLERGRIYVAPPDRHLLVEDGRLVLGFGPRENRVRPSIDPLLRSIGLCCGERAIGVVLTGTQSDGSAGLQTLKQCGGMTVVQDPNDAAFPEMPSSAVALCPPHHVSSLTEMPALLDRLVRSPAGEKLAPPDIVGYEVAIAKTGRSSMNTMDRFGRRSVLACPDCHGVMWEINEDDLLRYRCHTGHAYSSELMSLALQEDLTRALGSALRALEERVALASKLEKQAHETGRLHAAQSWARRESEYELETNVIRGAMKRIDEIGGAFRRPEDEQVLAETRPVLVAER
jgi:two-component system chemotaxis response regulator CheB